MVSIATAATYLWWPGNSPVPPATAAKVSTRPKPAMATPLEAIDPPPSTPQPSTPPPSAPPISSPSATPRADPFAYPTPASPEVAAAVRPTNSPSAALILQGISMGDGRGLAVVNRRIVAVGDSIGAWRIERIESSRVWIRSGNAHEPVALEFQRVPTPTR
ncbi:MAG: hypothetical protein JNK85_00270 [Verrucomicrobiales bacterium]|nr:hypothetical protein [Verrucomicrobiales bacterium]